MAARGAPLPGGGGTAGRAYVAGMDRVLRLWSAVSWWLVPLAIIALGAVDLAQNGSLSSEGAIAFAGPVAVHAGFLLLVTVPLYWRFRAPVTVAILVTASSGAWIVTMFTAQDQPPFEPAAGDPVAVFALASRVEAGGCGGAPGLRGLFSAGEIRSELGGQGIGNVFPAVLFFVLIFVMGRIVYGTGSAPRPAGPRRRLERDQEARQPVPSNRTGPDRPRTARRHRAQPERHRGASCGRAPGVAAGPGSAAETLEAIEQTGRQAMTELRRLLGLLRKSDGEPSLAPQPGLSGLDDLVAEVREAGVEVDVRTDGDLAAIPRTGPVGIPHRPGMPDQRAQARQRAPGGVSLSCRGRCSKSTSPTTGPLPGRRRGRLRAAGMRERVASTAGRCRPGPAMVAVSGSTPAAVRGRRDGPAMTIRVIIADDQELVRAGFRKLLDAEDAITVAGEAADGAEAVALATSWRPMSC